MSQLRCERDEAHDPHEWRQRFGVGLHVRYDCPGIANVPCPSKTACILGFPELTTIPCGLLAGHDGMHRFHVEWAGPQPTEAEQQRLDRLAAVASQRIEALNAEAQPTEER